MNHAPVERSREAYTARIIYQNNDAEIVGLITIRAASIAAFTAVANHILADAAVATALGGTAVRDSDSEKYTTTLKCHDQNGEIYFVDFSRSQVRLSSFSDDAIKSKVETWADTVAALN